MAKEYELKQVKVRLSLQEAEPLYSTEEMNNPAAAVKVMADALAQMDREYCCVVNLDNLNHPINFNIVSIGDTDKAQVPIQNVFKSAILSNATSIMMFHNHPSGNLVPSNADQKITRHIVEAGRLMNIPVLDHIIVGGGTGKYYSFHEEQPNIFPGRGSLLGDLKLLYQADRQTKDDRVNDKTPGRISANKDTVFTEVRDGTASDKEVEPVEIKDRMYADRELESETAVLEPKDSRTDKEIIAEFREKTDALFDKKPFKGMTATEIEEAVRAHIEQVVYDYDLDVEIDDVIITGSRCRGLENDGSDLDVVLYYAGTNRGSEREDDLFAFLHEDKLYLDGVEVDINPISNAKRETLADYLLEAEKYLEEKKISLENERAERDRELDEMDNRNENGREVGGADISEEKDQEFDATDIFAERDDADRHPEKEERLENSVINESALKDTRRNSLKLASEIDTFAFECDTYEYRDRVDDREENVRTLAETLERGDLTDVKGYIGSFVEESGDAETIARAKELLKKLDEYKPLAKVEEQVEQNYNVIDNMINNLPRDENGQEESTLGIKIQRDRVSVKEKIAEKKALIESKSEHQAHEQEKAKKTPQRVVEN